jgi:hypothetical protein
LGLWEGVFQGIDRLWLRWFTLEGKLIYIPQEVVEAKKEAIKVKMRVEKLAEQLRQLGINPDDIE